MVTMQNPEIEIIDIVDKNDVVIGQEDKCVFMPENVFYTAKLAYLSVMKREDFYCAKF